MIGEIISDQVHGHGQVPSAPRSDVGESKLGSGGHPLKPARGRDEASRAAEEEEGEDEDEGSKPGGTSPDWARPAATAFLERGLARGETQWEAPERAAQDLTRASARRRGGRGWGC